VNRPPRIVIGCDGEGLTIRGEHLYGYFAAWTETDEVAVAEDMSGLHTRDILRTLIDIKKAHPDSLLVGFSLGYDITKWLEDVPAQTIYSLARPDRRSGRHGPRPVRYDRFLLNYLRGKFTVTELLPNEHRERCKNQNNGHCPGCKPGVSCTVWDVWGFFQGSYIDACLNWKVITKDEHAELKAMKAKRSTFKASEWDRITDYCGLECRRLATLVTRMIAAHGEAGLKLRSFFGAGSSATALMRAMNIKDFMGEVPEAMNDAISRAFFGGRFELSRIGPITNHVYCYDIASAYPDQLRRLPCLKHGAWRHVRGSRQTVERTIHSSNQALVEWSLDLDAADGRCNQHWGPFPFRCDDTNGPDGTEPGCIIWPAAGGTGWVGREEYLVAKEHWKGVRARSAWVYEKRCDCQPFSEIPDLYLRRLQWGKDGPGIVLKLAMNSCYGKLAQSIGLNPPFQCFLWAALITSGTRAELLRAIALAPADVLMTATDGIVSRQRLSLSMAMIEGFRDAEGKEKPQLGQWECDDKTAKLGIMLIRPGIAFPLGSEHVDPLKVGKEWKARGIGKATLAGHKQAIVDSWTANGEGSVRLKTIQFRGFKSGVTPGGRSPEYGKWVERSIDMSYMPEPKRPMGVGVGGRLGVWRVRRGARSAAYDKMVQDSESRAHEAFKAVQSEQPDRETA
jgi:DNA polymerase type B, organellar and viral